MYQGKKTPKLKKPHSRLLLFFCLVTQFCVACNDSKPDESQVRLFEVSGKDESSLIIQGKHRVYVKQVLEPKDSSLYEVRVHLVDMIHIGPESFYDQIEDILLDVSQQSLLPIILREGYYCDEDSEKSIIAIENSRYFKPRLLPAFHSKSLVGARIALEQFTPEDLERLAKSRFIKKSSCSEFTQSGKNSISKVYQDLAEKYDLVTQESRKNLMPQGVISKKTDLDISFLRPYQRLIFGLYLSCVIDEKCANQSGGFLQWLEEAQTYQAQSFKDALKQIIHTIRNENLVREIKAQVSSGATDLIVPWGEGHMQVIELELHKLGFTVQTDTSIPIASCDMIVENYLLNHLFGQSCQEAIAKASKAKLCDSYKKMAEVREELSLSLPSYCN